MGVTGANINRHCIYTTILYDSESYRFNILSYEAGNTFLVNCVLGVCVLQYFLYMRVQHTKTKGAERGAVV